MQRIVFLDRATLAPQIVLREPRFEHQLIEHDHTTPDQLLKRLALMCSRLRHGCCFPSWKLLRSKTMSTFRGVGPRCLQMPRPSISVARFCPSFPRF